VNSDVDRLAVLGALHVPDAGLVPRGRKLRESQDSNQRCREQAKRHRTLPGAEHLSLVHVRKHSRWNVLRERSLVQPNVERA
jgi:hypothetical protein